MVNVLISSYNGECFIEQQIESILSQSYTDFHIYIRDDGSNDRTVQVISKYMKTGKVSICYGKNIGFAQSFMELLRIANEGDYWAFCDQDDVWHLDKLLWAVEWLEQQDNHIPCLFHNAFENVDVDMGHLSYYRRPKYEYSFQRALTECMYFGFSMVINASLRKMMLLGNPCNIVSHDWWAQLIAISFGKCEFDPRVASKHRRHERSVTLDNNRIKIRWFLRSLNASNEISNNAKEFERVFLEQLNYDEKELLKLFTNKCVRNNVIRAFYPKRWRPSWPSEISLRWLMLLGKS